MALIGVESGWHGSVYNYKVSFEITIDVVYIVDIHKYHDGIKIDSIAMLDKSSEYIIDNIERTIRDRMQIIRNRAKSFDRFLELREKYAEKTLVSSNLTVFEIDYNSKTIYLKGSDGSKFKVHFDSTTGHYSIFIFGEIKSWEMLHSNVESDIWYLEKSKVEKEKMLECIEKAIAFIEGLSYN